VDGTIPFSKVRSRAVITPWMKLIAENVTPTGSEWSLAYTKRINEEGQALHADFQFSNVRFCACPFLSSTSSLRSGDILVMDNRSSHKNVSTFLKFYSKGVEVRFLRPYSPGLNPIKKIFSKIKAILRSLSARTSQTLEKAISTAIKSITPLDCLNCFHAFGYGLQATERRSSKCVHGFYT
jgi:hypothetical protein